MYKVAVMGDYESIYGFSSIGLETFPVTLPDMAKATLRRLAKEKYGAIYITEVLADMIREEIELYKEEVTPAIILIPGTYGNTGQGVAGVKASVEQAVGSDILFGND